MNGISGGKWWRFLQILLLVTTVGLRFDRGLCDDSKSGESGSTVTVLVVVVVAAVALLSFLALKLWQKKKREEQYARLLKLFEEDDELELELG